MTTNQIQMLDFQLSNTLEDIGLLGENIEEWGLSASVPRKIIGCMTLMLDELATNIIMHGYPEGTDAHIKVSLAIEEGYMVATLQDWAPAFDPFSIADADTTLAIEDREIGGLGVHFVRQMADEYSYVRNGDANVVCLKKRLSDAEIPRSLN